MIITILYIVCVNQVRCKFGPIETCLPVFCIMQIILSLFPHHSLSFALYVERGIVLNYKAQVFVLNNRVPGFYLLIVTVRAYANMMQFPIFDVSQTRKSMVEVQHVNFFLFFKKNTQESNKKEEENLGVKMKNDIASQLLYFSGEKKLGT